MIMKAPTIATAASMSPMNPRLRPGKARLCSAVSARVPARAVSQGVARYAAKRRRACRGDQ
jgi:hypothetical protein